MKHSILFSSVILFSLSSSPALSSNVCQVPQLVDRVLTRNEYSAPATMLLEAAKSRDAGAERLMEIHKLSIGAIARIFPGAEAHSSNSNQYRLNRREPVSIAISQDSRIFKELGTLVSGQSGAARSFSITPVELKISDFIRSPEDMKALRIVIPMANDQNLVVRNASNRDVFLGHNSLKSGNSTSMSLDSRGMEIRLATIHQATPTERGYLEFEILRVPEHLDLKIDNSLELQWYDR